MNTPIIWSRVMGSYCSPVGAGSSSLWLWEWGQSCGWLDWCRSSSFWLTLAWQESRAARCIFALLSGFKNRGQNLSSSKSLKSWVNAPHSHIEFATLCWNHANYLFVAIFCANSLHGSTCISSAACKILSKEVCRSFKCRSVYESGRLYCVLLHLFQPMLFLARSNELYQTYVKYMTALQQRQMA